jgi:cytochrome c oxidase accessory protein FixG
MNSQTVGGGKEEIQYFAKRVKLYPQRVWGKFRRLKWMIMVICLGIYYLAPFLRWDRGPNAPDQAILIDMANRKAYFFFLEIWPQEVYYLTGILILAAVSLFAVTSLFGRVWCGYTCFQTVWTDLFIWVERIILGDRNTRMRIDKAPWTWNKIWRKTLVHVVWLVIGAFTGGAWVLYFNDAPTLVQQAMHGEMSWDVGGWIVALTFSTYLMAGFAREQVCIYMCPYARFQSAMFDRDSLIVGYDTFRGEPRGSFKQGTDTWEGRGDCIDCNQCVVVCPTGIDIRNGLQLECIACGLCVDACNNVMDKMGRPRGLIRYDSQNNFDAEKQGKSGMVHILRPRTFYYACIIAIVMGVMTYGWMTRSSLELHVLQTRNPLFVQLSNGDIRNSYTLKILNKTHDDKRFTLMVQGMDGLKFNLESGQHVPATNVPVFADSVGQFRLFVEAPAPKDERVVLEFTVRDNATGVEDSYTGVFISRK